jgi:hypothetical protein
MGREAGGSLAAWAAPTRTIAETAFTLMTKSQRKTSASSFDWTSQFGAGMDGEWYHSTQSSSVAHRRKFLFQWPPMIQKSLSSQSNPNDPVDNCTF